MHQSSLDNMRAFRDRYLKPRENEALLILDLGSMDVSGSYAPCFDLPRWRYRGVDLAPGKNVDIVLQNPYRWSELESDSADVFISGQTFEHIEFFWLTVLEIARVLKPGGLCCLIAPSGGPEHRYPLDCWRFLPDGFAALARFAAIEVLEVYCQQGGTGYADGSNMWQDTVLVGRKPALAPATSWKTWLRRYLLHVLLREAEGVR